MYNKRGASLIEVMLAVVLVSAIMSGLAVVYVFAIDAWDKTAKKAVLNESGSYALFCLSRDIQRADSLEILRGGEELFMRIRPFTDTVPPYFVRYTLEENELRRDSSGTPKIIIPQFKSDSIGLHLLEGKKLFTLNRTLPINEFDRIIDVSFQLQLKTSKLEEETEFHSTMIARNLSL